MRYDRWLSPASFDLLTDSGPLRFLVRDFRTWIPDDANALDLQLRTGDRLMYYHGTVSLLTVAVSPTNGTVTVSSPSAFAAVPGFDSLVRTWPLSQIDELKTQLPAFLSAATRFCGDGHYLNRREGCWQNRLTLAFGLEWVPGMTWLVVDREAVVGFPSDAERSAVQGPIQRKYLEVRDLLQREDSKTWGVPDGKGLGNEVDLLALGPGGELVCVELKHGMNASGVYWGRLQAAVYRDLFHCALPHITDDLLRLVRQKVELELLPRSALARVPDGGFRCVASVLAVAEPNDGSSCWELSRKILQRCPDADVPVVEIRDFDDPAPVPRWI